MGMPPSSGTGYSTLSPAIENSFDAAYDFGKPLREVIETIGGQCQKALKLLLGMAKWLIIVLITIDLALGAARYVVDSGKGSEFVSFVLLKLTLYCLLVYFLGNWGDAIANFARDMFTGFGGLMMGESGEAAMKAISDPMDIVSKGAHIVAPIYNEMFKIHSVLDLVSKIDLWLPSFFFAAILTICFFAVAISITLAYLEFYTVMVFSFGTFFLSGLHHTRKYAANGINGIFAVSIKLMFYCMFSLMLQMVLSNMVVDDFYTVHRGETPGIMAEAPVPPTTEPLPPLTSSWRISAPWNPADATMWTTAWAISGRIRLIMPTTTTGRIGRRCM